MITYNLILKLKVKKESDFEIQLKHTIIKMMKILILNELRFLIPLDRD